MKIVATQNRWLLVEFIPCAGSDGEKRATYAPSEGLNGKHIYTALRESMLHNFGDTGWGAMGTSLTGTSFYLLDELT